jgi:hypothetical protein
MLLKFTLREEKRNRQKTFRPIFSYVLRLFCTSFSNYNQTLFSDHLKITSSILSRALTSFHRTKAF